MSGCSDKQILGLKLMLTGVVSIVFMLTAYLFTASLPDHVKNLSTNSTRIGPIETIVIVRQHIPWDSQTIIVAWFLFSFFLAFIMIFIWKAE